MNIRRPDRFRPAVLASGFWLLACLVPVFADSPTQPAKEAHWGERVGNFQSRLNISADAAVASPLPVTIELKNVADATAPIKDIRIWILAAQGKDNAFFSAPFTAQAKPLASGGTQVISFDAATLAAFRYVPDYQIKDGFPTPADPKAVVPKPLGKFTEVLPTGAVKLKAFVVLTRESAIKDAPPPKAGGAVADDPLKAAKDPRKAEKGAEAMGNDLEIKKIEIVPTATVAITFAEARAVDLAKLDADGKAAIFNQLTTGFHGDAVAAKNAHDRALKLGQGVVPHLLSIIDDKELTGAGKMWLAASLVDLHDDRAIAPLMKILEGGGPGARVIAYMGPRLKDPRLTAAIQKTASSTKDQELIAWSVRGLGLNGEKTDPKLFAIMVAHSDSAGREEAAKVIAASADPAAITQLAKLINDPEKLVARVAITAAYANKRADAPIIAALNKAAAGSDSDIAGMAKQCLDKFKQEGLLK